MSPYDKAKLSDYFSGNIKNIPDSEFEALLSHAIPDGSRSGTLDMNDAICQLYYAKSGIARFAYKSYLKYETANSTVNSHGISYVFDEKVSVPGVAYPVKALCAYHIGTLGSGANGQHWNFMEEVTDPSLKAVLTYVYSCTNGDFTDAGKAMGFEAWPQGWADLWFIVAQSLTCTTRKPSL